jgi:hypothetical protein
VSCALILDCDMAIVILLYNTGSCDDRTMTFTLLCVLLTEKNDQCLLLLYTVVYQINSLALFQVSYMINICEESTSKICQKLVAIWGKSAYNR